MAREGGCGLCVQYTVGWYIRCLMLWCDWSVEGFRMPTVRPNHDAGRRRQREMDLPPPTSYWLPPSSLILYSLRLCSKQGRILPEASSLVG